MSYKIKTPNREVKFEKFEKEAYDYCRKSLYSGTYVIILKEKTIKVK
jgi:hypothetical protein